MFSQLTSLTLESVSFVFMFNYCIFIFVLFSIIISRYELAVSLRGAARLVSPPTCNQSNGSPQTWNCSCVGCVTVSVPGTVKRRQYMLKQMISKIWQQVSRKSPPFQSLGQGGVVFCTVFCTDPLPKPLSANKRSSKGSDMIQSFPSQMRCVMAASFRYQK